MKKIGTTIRSCRGDWVGYIHVYICACSGLLDNVDAKDVY